MVVAVTRQPPPARRARAHGRRIVAAIPPTPCVAEVLYGGCMVLVRDRSHMQLLWSHGAYGSGNLSRSDPTWWSRMLKKLEPPLPRAKGNSGAFVEDISAQRKATRRQTKKTNEPTPDGVDTQQQRDLEQLGVLDAQGLLLPDVESMQLMPEEAIFLFACGKLVTRDGSGLSLPLALESPTHRARTAAYAYFRRHGWAPRCGSKFGVDFLLYSQSPQFGHSPYAVVVIPVAGDLPSFLPLPPSPHPLGWLKAAQRVVGHAKKKLVLCYVSDPAPVTADRAWIVHSSLWWLFLAWYLARSALSILLPWKPSVDEAFPRGKLETSRAMFAALPNGLEGCRIHCVELGRWSADKNRE